MRANFQTGSLDGRTINFPMPAPRVRVRFGRKPVRVVSGIEVHSVYKSAARVSFGEDFVWLALMFSASAVLALSLWL